MTPHSCLMFDKKILFTDKTVFRVEESRNSRASYEGVFVSNDPLKAIRYYQNTVKPNGWRLRLIKDGDEYILINKRQF